MDGTNLRAANALPPADGRTPLIIDPNAVRSFLLDHRAPIAAGTLSAAGLAPYAYCALPADDPRRPALRGDYLRSLRRHQEIRIQVARLLQRWHAAGIEALLFKGFQLAEFVYPKPGMRFHGDVDLVIRPEHAERAVRMAREDGWIEAPSRLATSHEVCGLYGPSGTKVDLHRYVLQRWMPWGRVPPRITRAVWERSERIGWEGVPLHLPAAVDALLVGLVLQRMWSDRGYLKPHDAIDFRLLTERVSRDELWARARALRCTRTLAHFLHRCDPERGQLRLRPSRADRVRLGLAVRRERGLFSGPVRLHRAPGLLVDIVRVLPEVMAARRRLRAETDLRRLFERLTPAPPAARSSLQRRHRTVRAIRWATRLFRLNPGGDCVLRSVAIYTALARQGWPVTFVSGVRRETGRVEGHAWVECDGRELLELYEPSVRLVYREAFRWPVAPAEGD